MRNTIEITRHLNVCGPVPVPKWGWCVKNDRDVPIHVSPSYAEWADMMADLDVNGRRWLQRDPSGKLPANLARTTNKGFL